MSEFVLEMKGINKTFPGVHALKDVDLQVRKNEVLGLIGENGAGKSTLMNVLMGIYKADSGEVRVNGQPVSISSPTQAIKVGIGMVPQELNLNPYVSVAENIFLGNEILRNGRIDWKKTNEESVRVLKTIGVEINPEIETRKLSVAQQQLVQIARVVATGAELLVFDEPTAALTATETDFLLQLMGRLTKEDKSIIFITHHLEELLSSTDRITTMRDGAVVNVSDTKDITIDILIDYMAGKKIVKQERQSRSIAEDELLRVEHFSRKNEFNDVSFSVHKGEIFGIGGLIGSGRTELANAIFGLTQKDSGTLYFNGQKVDIKSPPQAIALGMGYVPEERRAHGIFPVLTVRENLVISVYDRIFKRMRLQNKQAKQIASGFIQSMSIKTPTDEAQIKNLSGGNQQKVILARWLARNASLLILDEPTRGIDVNAKGEIYKLIRQLTKDGMTVIIISSEHEELLYLTDRVMIMHEGAVKGIKNTSDLKQQDILEVALR